ncbi:unnamed protein product [Effrenium voratum]|nr:unnamed protein product [Effrenium voratum]
MPMVNEAGDDLAAGLIALRGSQIVPCSNAEVQIGTFRLHDVNRAIPDAQIATWCMKSSAHRKPMSSSPRLAGFALQSCPQKLSHGLLRRLWDLLKSFCHCSISIVLTKNLAPR